MNRRALDAPCDVPVDVEAVRDGTARRTAEAAPQRRIMKEPVDRVRHGSFVVRL
jgi:hypothetical protein